MQFTLAYCASVAYLCIVKRRTKANKREQKNAKITIMATKETRYPLSAEKKILLLHRRDRDAGIIAIRLNISPTQVRRVFMGNAQDEDVWHELAKLAQERTAKMQQVSATAFQVLVDAGVEQFMRKHAGKITDLEFEEFRKVKQSESAALFEELIQDGQKLNLLFQTIKQNLEAENRAKT